MAFLKLYFGDTVRILNFYWWTFENLKTLHHLPIAPPSSTFTTSLLLFFPPLPPLHSTAPKREGRREKRAEGKREERDREKGWWLLTVLVGDLRKKKGDDNLFTYFFSVFECNFGVVCRVTVDSINKNNFEKRGQSVQNWAFWERSSFSHLLLVDSFLDH